ncbi:hypothetical protein WV34_03550 [Bacillus amyloliquefaciens]|uniref:hypothetical protein n=1 Tax=Bacillaceae TaxID=186817 RepID=UPI000B518883|nr:MULTISPECIES: hypothetical protein [Bacillus amyloliquefaciens group]ASF27898.1 hypothetical protein WV34_03550 [Bacillus amyloliquefaciens]
MVPLVLNQAELIGALEKEKMINHKYVILEMLREELQGIDNSLYIEMSVYFYVENEQDEDKTFHFIFANVPHKQNKVTGNPKSAIITVEFLALEVHE